MSADNPTRCNMCEWNGEEADLIACKDAQDGEYTNAACPTCKTDHFIAEADAQVAAIMAQSDDEILASSTPEEIDAACKMHGAIMAIRERASIIAFLRNGGQTIRGQWFAWDMEMRGYAASFADMIAREDRNQ